jgi:hypothetical protein
MIHRFAALWVLVSSRFMPHTFGSDMIGRYLLSIFIAGFLTSGVAIAQAPAQATPVPTYTGNIGGGLALTDGNTDTRTFNLAGAIIRDPKTRNVIKGSASYLRGSQSDVLNLDRTSINARDEYSLSNRTFVFGQLDYLRDQFKEIVFFWASTAGVGYKFVNTDATQFIVDGGAGGVIEKNPGIPSSSTGELDDRPTLSTPELFDCNVYRVPVIDLEDERLQ